MKLKNKTAFITGADSGIGQATAIEFAKEGAGIIITFYSDESGAEKTLNEIEKFGREGLILQLDQRNEDEVERCFDAGLRKFGKIDILVNNAALNFSGKKISEFDTETFDKIIKTNLYGYFFCSRRFVRERIKAGGGGKLINISSVHEEIPMKGGSGYDASKGAIRNLMRTMALELAEYNINVNNIAPGTVLTPFNQEIVDDEELREKTVQIIPMKRAAKPEEVGKVAVFLASEDSDYVTGSTYVIDGGLMQMQGQGA